MITNTDLGISVTSGYGKLRLKTAPTATPVSVAEAKTHLRIDSSFTADDTYIETLISVATFAAENYMNLWIMQQSWYLDIDSFPDYFNLLRGQNDDLTINSITYADTANANQTLAASNYFGDGSMKPARIYFAPDATIPSTYDKPNAVVVDFTAGNRNASDVPAPIRQAILLTIGRYYEIRQDVVTGTIATAIPKTVEFLLEPYRVQG